MLKRIAALLLVLLFVFSLASCEFADELRAEIENDIRSAVDDAISDIVSIPGEDDPEIPTKQKERTEPAAVEEDGEYDSKDEVAEYIRLYGHLPSNYITKKKAQSLGWSGGGLEKYAPGKSIGGDRFGNYEGKLPDAKGRTWYECDVDTRGASRRGEKRIVFSNDGLIYYSDDHYNTFTPIYVPED